VHSRHLFTKAAPRLPGKAQWRTCRRTICRPGLLPGSRWELTALPIPLSDGGGLVPFPKIHTPAVGPSSLATSPDIGQLH